MATLCRAAVRRSDLERHPMPSPSTPQDSSLNWRLRLVKPAKLAAFVSLVALVVVLTAWQYRTHLFWRFGASRAQVDSVQAIPVHAMPKTAVPEDWTPHEAGGVEFRLPAELVLDPEEFSGERDSYQLYRGNRFSVIVSWTDDSSHWDDLLSLATAFSPESETFTYPQLRLEFYRASASDFRWTMTRQEVQWHVLCMTLGKITRLISAGHVEKSFTRDREAIIHFGENSTTLEWQCKESARGGYMHFQFDEQPENLEWVRAVCASLQSRNVN